MEHGLNKLFDFPPTPTHVPYHVASLVPGLAGPLEAVGGVLVALGLFTRPAAFILSGQMAVAYLVAHAPKSFFPLLNDGDAAILYCFIFLLFFCRGRRRLEPRPTARRGVLSAGTVATLRQRFESSRNSA
jgi:putative oxidoreductase